MTFDPPFVKTEDGSITLRDQDTGELYHNRAGAYTEALHNYVEPCGVITKLNNGLRQVKLLDACFGLGYNSFVFLSEVIKTGLPCQVSIVGVELDPAVLATISAVLADTRLHEVSTAFGAEPPSTFGNYFGRHGQCEFSMELLCADLRRRIFELPTDFDYIFHDPFSPRKVPELWTAELFARYYQLLAPRKGEILTYSSAGAVRGALLESGFTVYRTAAVGAKLGGSLGSVIELIEPRPEVQVLSDAELVKLQGKSGVPYRDADLSRSRQQIIDERHSEQSSRS